MATNGNTVEIISPSLESILKQKSRSVAYLTTPCSTAAPSESSPHTSTTFSPRLSPQNSSATLQAAQSPRASLSRKVAPQSPRATSNRPLLGSPRAIGRDLYLAPQDKATGVRGQYAWDFHASFVTEHDLRTKQKSWRNEMEKEARKIKQDNKLHAVEQMQEQKKISHLQKQGMLELKNECVQKLREAKRAQELLKLEREKSAVQIQRDLQREERERQHQAIQSKHRNQVDDRYLSSERNRQRIAQRRQHEALLSARDMRTSDGDFPLKTLARLSNGVPRAQTRNIC